MASKKTCPSCKREIDDSAVVCPECLERLEILNWEIEQESGERIIYSNVETIREGLISGKLKLSNKCRQYTDVLVQVTEGQKQYSKKDEMEWKTLKDYADNEFALLSLYDPKAAYGKKAAYIMFWVVGSISAVGWVAIGLSTVGANPFVAIILSIVLLIAFPTVIGAFIGVGLTSTYYNIPAFGLALRVIIAYVLGVVIGGVLGLPLGYLAGILIGSRKPKVIEPDPSNNSNS